MIHALVAYVFVVEVQGEGRNQFNQLVKTSF